MGISINSKLSGFRKWVEIHDPEKIGEVRAATKKDGVIAAADVDQGSTTSDRQPHHPGLVPGVGASSNAHA
jgi:hypothetical protein